MRFRTRLVLTYFFLIFFLVVVLGAGFYQYSAALFERNAAENYGLLAGRIGGQLDDLVRPMDFISTNLISDGPFKSALASLARLDRGDPRNALFLNEAVTTVRGSLMTYSIHKNFHGVVFFNGKGDFFSSNFIEHVGTSRSSGIMAGLPWLSRAEKADGRSVFVPPYDDPWGTSQTRTVFSWARMIPGSAEPLGFLEVQKDFAELKAVLSVPDADFVRVYVFREDGEPVYADRSLSPEEAAYYQSGGTASFTRNPVSGAAQLIAVHFSAYTGCRVVLVVDRRLLLKPLAFIKTITAAIALLIICFSVAYVGVSSRLLVEPLRRMRKLMEETELANLPDSPLGLPNDEVASLDLAFHRLTRRLDEALKNELRSHTAWMSARLDSLQAQINPHFLYNVLTVIAGRGLERGDEEIADMCEGIAAMLRYSTSTAERSATVAEEIGHVRTYLFLMKKRLEDKLRFEIDIDQPLLTMRMPKIILQQIVENSIAHGYGEGIAELVVRIRGIADGEGWRLEITDTGRGFSPDALAEIRARIDEAGVEDSELGIGGLGLIATYARLRLFFGGALTWELADNPGGGARVSFGCGAEACIQS